MMDINKKTEKLLETAFRTSPAPDQELEEITMQKIEQKLEETIEKREKRQMRHAFRPAAAILCALLIAIATGGYAIARYMPSADYYTKYYPDMEKNLKAIEELSADDIQVDVEKNSFKDIKITPVAAVSDGNISYAVLKVQGINGYTITDKVGFCNSLSAMVLNDDEDDLYDSTAETAYISRREKNTFYFTLALFGTGQKLSDSYKIGLSVQDLIKVKKDKDGIERPSKESTDKDGKVVFPVVEEGVYSATLSCRTSARISTREIPKEKLKDFSVYISPLGLTMDNMERGIWDTTINATSTDNNAYVVLKDGSKVSLEGHGGSYDPDSEETANGVSINKFQQVIPNPEDISKLVINDKEYDL